MNLFGKPRIILEESKLVLTELTQIKEALILQCIILPHSWKFIYQDYDT